LSLKTLLVGCGAISKKHIQALIDNNDTYDLAAVCDISEENARKAAAQYTDAGLPKPAFYSDYTEAIDSVKPDVVAVATSSAFHHPIGMKALEAGAHVVMEKPIALSSAQSQELIDTAEKHSRKITVCYITRFAPHMRALKRKIDDGSFSRIFSGSVTVHWNRNDEYYRKAPWRGTWEKDGGALMNQCTHAIDLLQWFLGGDIRKVYGVIRRYLRPIESEDFGSGIVQFGSGAIGTITGTVNVYPKNLDETLSIFGETGTAVIGGTHMDKVETWQFEDDAEYNNPEEQPRGHSGLYRDFAEAVVQDRDPVVCGIEGKKSVDIVLGIYKSMVEGCEVEHPFEFDTSLMKGSFV
jgi:UDP-N-acetyl-2-amino-2-deoxyglucuronate dehydrogenase